MTPKEQQFIITFRSGNKIKVSRGIVVGLNAQVMSAKGASKFQFFYENDPSNIILCFNIEEVESITTKENII